LGIGKQLKMTKIFVVTSGAYSDYGIDTIFSTRELAQEFIDFFKKRDNWDVYKIEEWELDKYNLGYKGKRKPFTVSIEKNGDVEIVREGMPYEEYSSDLNFIVEYYGFEDLTANIVVFADDEKHAVKIANEKRTWILANNLWGEEIKELAGKK
jgi:hypothetical protein